MLLDRQLNIMGSVHISAISTNAHGITFGVAVRKVSCRFEPDTPLAAASASCVFASTSALVLGGHSVP